MVTAAMAGEPLRYWSVCPFAILWQIQQNPKTMHWLPSFAARFALLVTITCDAVAYAQSASPAPAAKHEAEQLWQRARIALGEHVSVQAKLIQDIDIYGQRLMGSGAYLQGPPRYHWVHLDLAIKTEPYDTILQQRCDGDFLWILHSADGLSRVEKVDIRRVLAAGRVQRDGTLVPMLGIGGLPKLFDSLDKAFVFVEVRQEKLDGQVVYMLRGEWRPDRLVRWLPEQKEAIEAGRRLDLAKLPQPVPDHVLIYLEGRDLFPRRIDYRRADPSDRLSGRGSKSLVLLRFSDVVFDAPVDRRNFTYEPGLLPVSDETEQYIRKLGLTPTP